MDYPLTIGYDLKNVTVRRRSWPEYELVIGEVIIPIERETAHQLVVASLIDASLIPVGIAVPTEIAELLCWHVNESRGSIFFNNYYPEWCVVPCPKKWVAGSDYFEQKTGAEAHLDKRLKEEINAIQAKCNRDIKALQRYSNERMS